MNYDAVQYHLVNATHGQYVKSKYTTVLEASSVAR